MDEALGFVAETAANAFRAAKEAPMWAKAAMAAGALFAVREAYLAATEVSTARAWRAAQSPIAAVAATKAGCQGEQVPRWFRCGRSCTGTTFPC